MVSCPLFTSPSDVSIFVRDSQKLLEEDFVKANPLWVAELELMLKTKEKAEIQVIMKEMSTCHRIRFLHCDRTLLSHDYRWNEGHPFSDHFLTATLLTWTKKRELHHASAVLTRRD